MTKSDQATIQEAAQALGVSEKTIRRRLRTGQLSGQLVQGRWTVVLPVSNAESDVVKHLTARLEAMQAERDWLRTHTEQLTYINATQAQTIHEYEQRLLPAPRTEANQDGHRRWKFWANKRADT